MTSLQQLLQQPGVRLITITGTFGVGKTSLALAVSHEVQPHFADGVTFISLAPLSDPILLIPTIAQTLQVPEVPSRLEIDSLKDFLQRRQILLVLDNFEHIISVAPILSELLTSCPDLRCLVTSREPLRLRGEQEFLLSPLAIPEQTITEGLLEYSSVALFVQRAQAAQFDFELTEHNALDVAGICTLFGRVAVGPGVGCRSDQIFPTTGDVEPTTKCSLTTLAGRGTRPTRPATDPATGRSVEL